MYDVVIRNGTIIDPLTGRNEPGTIHTRDGVIVEKNDADDREEPGRVIDATDCLVVPGLIDVHMHLFEGGNELGGNADIICTPNGVTSAIDAGSAGYETFPAFYRGPVSHAHTDIYGLLHVMPSGVAMTPHDEPNDPAFYNEKKTLALFERYGDRIPGLKVRQQYHSAGKRGNSPLLAAVALAERVTAAGRHCNVTVHFGDLGPTLKVRDVVGPLRPGDVFTHLYQGKGKTILDDGGRVRACFREGRERGVLFDSGCSRTNFSFDIMRRACAQGFYPDLIGSDIVGWTAYRMPVVSLPNQMSLFHNLGMPLVDVLRAVTSTPAQTYGLNAGTLALGARADIAVLKMIPCGKEYRDQFGGVFTSEKLFMPIATVKNGKTAFAQIFV